MLKPIPMFADLHTSLLKYLVEQHLQIHVLNSGDAVQMKDIIEDMDFVYVYRGKLRIRMEHIYGKLGPRGGDSSKCRYSVLGRGESLNPLNVASFLQSGKHGSDVPLVNQRVAKLQAVSDETVILQLSGYFIRNFFDPGKQHNVKYQGRSIEGVLRDAMSGYFGINQTQRQVINNAFTFEIIEPSALLVEEGQKADYLYIILRGMLDVRQRLPAQQQLRGIAS